MAKTKESSTAKAEKSQEYVDDSTSDESSAPAPTQKAARKESTVKPKSPSEVDSDTSSNEDSSSETSSPSSTSTKSAGTKRKSEPAKQTVKPVSKKHKTTTGKSSSKRDYYKPPTGYNPIDLDATDFVSETASMFSKLDGKQIWHITAPASLPVTSIETLDVQAALRGDPIFDHNGVSYNMFAAPPKGEALLLPRGTNSAYAPAKVDISRNFHLREVPHISESSAPADPSISEDKASQNGEHFDTSNYQFFAHEQGTQKPARKQPSGLLMRYRPFGSTKQSNKPYRLSRPDVDEADEIDDVSRNHLVVPIAESDDDGTSRHHTGSKKDKKSKKSKSSGISKSNGTSREDAMDVDVDYGNNSTSTPRSKAKSSGMQPESGRKKRKDR